MQLVLGEEPEQGSHGRLLKPVGVHVQRGVACEFGVGEHVQGAELNPRVWGKRWESLWRVLAALPPHAGEVAWGGGTGWGPKN